jgi:hypothetical protein
MSMNGREGRRFGPDSCEFNRKVNSRKEKARWSPNTYTSLFCSFRQLVPNTEQCGHAMTFTVREAAASAPTRDQSNSGPRLAEHRCRRIYS